MDDFLGVLKGFHKVHQNATGEIVVLEDSSNNSRPGSKVETSGDIVDLYN
jgi:hypothetical protein